MFYKKVFNHYGSKGFTLFELLIVILLVAVVGGISVVILVSSLRGSNRTNTISKVRASGNHAITQMSKMIKYSRSFDGVSNADYHANPSAWQDECSAGLSKRSLRITSFDGGTTTFDCINATGPSDNGKISSNSAGMESFLVDPAAIKVESCSFTCNRVNANNPATITIDFTLSSVTGSTFYENQAAIPFHTSVTVRNY